MLKLREGDKLGEILIEGEILGLKEDDIEELIEGDILGEILMLGL